jgi:urea transporter
MNAGARAWAAASTGLRGGGQVVFQESMVSGAIVLAGIMWCARFAGAWACTGAARGGGLWILLGRDPGGHAAGLGGYNAALTAPFVPASWAALAVASMVLGRHRAGLALRRGER